MVKMYIPKKFRQDKIEKLVVLMRKYPFATLVVQSDQGVIQGLSSLNDSASEEIASMIEHANTFMTEPIN